MKNAIANTAIGVGALAFGGSLAFGLILGGGIAAAAGVGAAEHEPVPFKTNEAGQTFGSNAFSSSPETDPDLVLVVGDSGHEGYVYSSELNDPAPASPREALASQAAPGEIDFVLDVYAQDGVTVIDTFTVLGGVTEEFSE